MSTRYPFEELESLEELREIEIGSVWVDYLDLALKALLVIAAFLVAWKL